MASLWNVSRAAWRSLVTVAAWDLPNPSGFPLGRRVPGCCSGVVLLRRDGPVFTGRTSARRTAAQRTVSGRRML